MKKWFLVFALLLVLTIQDELYSLRSTAATQIGIDVSSYQGIIDWNKVVNEGIKFVILRGTVRNGSLDAQFERNYLEATSRGLPVSCYKFSYALTIEASKNEATNLISKLNGKKIPIWLDLEWESQIALGRQAITDLAIAFIQVAQSHGYEVHIYWNKNWYKNYIIPSQFKPYGCKFWIASYGKNTGEIESQFRPNLGEYIWQYTSRGTVKGISGDVDMNVIYSDEPTPEPSKTEKMVKIIASSINRRRTPNGDVVGYYVKDNIVQVVGISDDGKWYLDNHGIYFTSNTAFVLDLNGKITATTLNVRQEPNTTAGILGVLKNGEVISIIKHSGSWYYMKSSRGLNGYVHSSYVTLF